MLGRFVGPAGAALFSLVLASCAGGGFGGAGDTSDISGVNPVSQPAPVASGPISPASQRKVAEAVSGLNLGEETPPISPEDIAVSNDSGILDSNPFSSSAPAARLSGWGARADSTRKTQGYKAFEVAVPSENPLMTVAVWISETPPDYPEGKPEQDPEADRKFLYLRLQVFIEVGHAALVEGGGVEVLDSEVIVVEEKRPDPKPIVPDEPEPQPDPNAPVLVAVNFSSSGSGTVSAEGESGALVAGGEVRQGSTVIFTAIPVAGYYVSGWWNCPENGTAKSCEVAADFDFSVSAIFTDINECETNTHICATEGGLCANTDGGFTCSCAIGYSGDGVTCNADKTVPDPNAPVLAAVNFSSSGSGTVLAEGESGALVAGGEVRQGSTVIFTATPGAGYYVSGWSGNCADAGEVADGLDGTAKSCAAAADFDLSVRAEFSEIPSLAGPLCPSGSLPTNGLTRTELNMTLRLAARGGDAARVCEALRRGAEVNDNLGDSEFTALQEAVDGGYLNVSELLLANEAEVNKRKGGSGRSPLDLAARDEEAEIAALLRNAGGRCFLETGPLCGDIPAATPDPATVAATVAGYACPAGSLPRGDHTQEQLDDNLHAAGWDLSAERVCEWLRRGADVNAKRGHKTLLHGAAWGAYEIAALLLANGADVNAKNWGQNTPLYAAATQDNREMAALLIANGADVNAKNYGNTPLHEAAGRNSEEVAALLIESGADVNAEVDFSGKGTPLHEAARENSEEVAALLLANGADVNVRAQWDGTPLHQAAYHNSREIVALLLENGADVNAETIGAGTFIHYMGGTALEIAGRRGHAAVVALLEAAKIPSIVSTVAATVAGYSCPAGSLPRGDHTQRQLDDNLYAAGWGLSAEGVCEWLRRGANVNAKRGHKTLLHGAAWGEYEMAALLLAHGADVNAKNLSNNTPLYAAATRDNREMAALLIANGADVNAKNYGNTPLHEAAGRNSEEVAALLIENGADVNAEVDFSGKGTPLHEAARENSEEVAALLLANGADVNARAQRDGTPLHQAAYHNSREIVALLLENGADVNAETIGAGTFIHYMGGTALEIAGRRGHAAVVALLEAAKIPSIVSTVAATVAGYSCPAGSLPRGDHTQEQLDGNLHAAGWDLSAERVCEWLRRGANVNAKRDHKTLLHVAAWGAYEIAALLLAHGADVNAKNLWKDPPLYAAATRDNREMAALLIANGADVNAKNYGNTPLHEAAFYNSEEVAALLIENGADVNAEVDMSGRGTPLHVAARHNSEEVAALLLANGADVNARAQWDGMPLHEAARHNSEEVVALLLANGADVNADSVGRNNLGGTALDIARRRRNSAVVALLEAAENLPVAAEADALAKELRESFAGAFNPSPAFGDAFGAVSGASEKILTRLDSLMRSTAGSGGDAWDSFSGWQRENDVGRMWFSTNQRGDFGFGVGGNGAGGDLSVSPFAALAGNGMLAGGETGFGESGKLRIAAFGDYQARSLLDGSDREWTQWAARGTAIEKAMTEAERFSGLSENRTRGAMTEIHLGGGDLGVALQAGAVSESDSVLSGTAGNDDLRGLRSRTAFAGLSGAADLFGSGWRLRGSAHLGRSWTESEGLLRDGDLWASAFSAGLERGGWLYLDDGFVLRFSQPLRVESWEMRLAGEQGGRWLGAGPSGRQLDVDAAYRLPLSGGGWLLLSAGVRRDGGHSSSSDLEAGALFSVERGF